MILESLSSSLLTKAHILIVDDQESNVLLLKTMLEDEDCVNLMTTTDSREVVALVHEFKPDLILLDLMMPHFDGYAVMEKLRQVIPADTYLPILVLTADATIQAKQRALELGANDFLTKPFDHIEVLLRIKNLLETRELHIQLQKQNQILNDKVLERTEHIQLQLEHLTALQAINTAIAGSLDLHLTLDIALEQIIAHLKVDAADVLLLNPHTQTLEYSAGRGFNFKAIEHTRVHLGESFAGQSVRDRSTVFIPDLQAKINDFVQPDLILTEGFVAYACIPLIAKGEVKGVIQAFNRTPYQASQDWLEFLEIFGRQVAIAIDSAQLFSNLQRSNVEIILAYDSTIESLSQVLDLKDKETEGHSQRVTEMTIALAQTMNMTGMELTQIRRGALLHDIGKIGIPDSILLKPGPLTDEEWVIMKQHPQHAFNILSPIAFLRPAMDIPYCHHEKWDGTGYPRGLKGNQIPMAARLFAVVDVWDALRSDRPYRKAWSAEKSHEHIKSLAGTHFDPEAIALFGLMMNEPAIKSIEKTSLPSFKKIPERYGKPNESRTPL
jgi:response regulator RpfG family c-di-GMP phosphodiesterase